MGTNDDIVFDDTPDEGINWSPIVTDLAQAEKILEWAVTKMDERYELLAETHVKNVASYNSLGADEVYIVYRLNKAFLAPAGQSRQPLFLRLVVGL